jgi:hypothetical protein
MRAFYLFTTKHWVHQEPDYLYKCHTFKEATQYVAQRYAGHENLLTYLEEWRGGGDCAHFHAQYKWIGGSWILMKKTEDPHLLSMGKEEL